MFKPSTWKNYCPECGERSIARIRRGCFQCSECGCEFTHNYKIWLLVGTPYVLLCLFVIFEAATQKDLPKGVFYFLIIVALVVTFASPDWYSITKHGREAESVDDEKHVA
jgi:hypothetical protein